MTGRVVGVHGIGNRQAGRTPAEAAATLGHRWTTALRRGLGASSQVEVAVAYYAHHLGGETVQSASDPAQLTEPEQQLLLDWTDALGAPNEIAQGRLTQPARMAADWIARRFGLDHALVRLLVTTFCREVYTYLTFPGQRAAARDAVADTITSERPQVLLAHSLGSVVAYEALWARPDLQVELLITLGSPLGMPDVVFDRLQPGPIEGRGQRPAGVQQWINIADPGDIIAIPRCLAQVFSGIGDDLTTPIGTFNFHKATGYLSTAATATALAAFLGYSPS